MTPERLASSIAEMEAALKANGKLNGEVKIPWPAGSLSAKIEEGRQLNEATLGKRATKKVPVKPKGASRGRSRRS